jgi:hypothetical protein
MPSASATYFPNPRFLPESLSEPKPQIVNQTDKTAITTRFSQISSIMVLAGTILRMVSIISLSCALAAAPLPLVSSSVKNSRNLGELVDKRIERNMQEKWKAIRAGVITKDPGSPRATKVKVFKDLPQDGNKISREAQVEALASFKLARGLSLTRDVKSSELAISRAEEEAFKAIEEVVKERLKVRPGLKLSWRSWP